MFMSVSVSLSVPVPVFVPVSVPVTVLAFMSAFLVVTVCLCRQRQSVFFVSEFVNVHNYGADIAHTDDTSLKRNIHCQPTASVVRAVRNDTMMYVFMYTYIY